ncbi:MAG: PAS domain S-box protein [Candidatus Thorarchaeota archaeon]
MTIEILLVDDDEDTLRIASRFLEKEDPTFEITAAVSAEFALELLERTSFDVIVSDYEMPNGLNGLEFLEQVRQERSEIPFIIFTGRGREEVAIKALNLGADLYLTKGGDPKNLYTELAHNIRNVVAHGRARSALVESDSRFRAAFEDAAIGMAIVSIDQQILQVNEKLTEMLGFDAEQLEGRNLEEIAHPDEIGQAPLKALRILDDDSTILSGERRFLHQDGKWVWTRTTSSLIRDSKGKPLYFVSQFQDITETKQAIEALRDSEERFRGAFEDAAIGMALVSFEGEKIHCNRALTQMLGYTNEEFMIRSFNEITHPDDIDKTPRIVDGKFENGRSTIQLEKRYIHKSGHIVYTFINSSIIYDRENNPIHYVTQFQDVTEQKLASDALAVSEANYRTLLERSLQNYAVIQDERYVYVNEAFARTLGISRAEALKLDPNQIWNLVHVDDMEMLKQRNKELQNGAEEVPKHEFRYIRPDGEIRWVEGLVRKFEYDGKPATQIVEIDITERKEYDEALQDSLEFLDTLLNTIVNPVFFKDRQGIYRRCNPAFATNIAGVPIEEVIGKKTEFILNRIRNLSEEDLDELDRTLLLSQDDQSFEIQIEDPEGLARDYLVNRSVYKDREGNSIGIVGILQDITTIRRLQMDLSHQKEELSEFAQVMSHDLLGLLHNAILYAELLEEEFDPANLSSIKDMISAAQDILRRSLRLAEAGLVIGELEEVDLNKLVDEIAGREVMEYAEFERDNLPSIRCDRLKMTQIITNLLRNAIEHGDPSKIWIKISSEKTLHNLFIINNGRPIPDEVCKSILEKSSSTKKHGGLGLMIVKKLVEAHGWKIALDDAQHPSFKITIPH